MITNSVLNIWAEQSAKVEKCGWRLVEIERIGVEIVEIERAEVEIVEIVYITI